MKIKTIEKVLQKKFDKFCQSITDESVRKLVQKNSIITGGAIASMLLQEKVNDYDIYFTDKETVLAVAEYYVKYFKAMPQKHGDGKDIVMAVVDCDNHQKIGDDHGDIKHLGSLSEPGRVKIYIKSAGIVGAQGTSNYEYFESRPDGEADDYVDQIVNSVAKLDDITIDKASDVKFKPVFISANAITLSDDVQIVIRFYGDPATIHQHYDYVHCTNYWLSSTGKLTLKEEALKALLSKELIYVGSKYPICSIIRTRKFIKRGWTINAGQYLKMCFQCSKLDLEDLNVLEDQLVGVDAAYFGQLIHGLKEQSDREKTDGKEFRLDYGYLASIVDRIF